MQIACKSRANRVQIYFSGDYPAFSVPFSLNFVFYENEKVFFLDSFLQLRLRVKKICS